MSNATVQLVGNITYIVINVILFFIIFGVSYKLIHQYRNAPAKPTKFLFWNGIFFNIVTFSCVFGLFFFSVLQLQSRLNGTDLYQNKTFLVYHSFWVMFYGKQNCVMLLILFTRLHLVFKDTSMALTNTTIRFFNVCFVIAIVLFTMLPFLHLIWPNISIWTWCASTFCFYNLSFMMTLTYLFLYKLKQVFTNFLLLHAKSIEYGLSTDEDQKQENEKMVKTFTKTALLALISIAMTSISCILLVLRFTFNFNDNNFVYTFSEMVISIDIYSNFLFVTLSYTYFDGVYYKLCKVCDIHCQSIWIKVLFDQNTKQTQNTTLPSVTPAECEHNEHHDIHRKKNQEEDMIEVISTTEPNHPSPGDIKPRASITNSAETNGSHGTEGTDATDATHPTASSHDDDEEEDVSF